MNKPKYRPVRKFKWHVTGSLGDRVEDFGIFEATTGQRARDAARSQHAEKLGIRRKRDGSWTGKWRMHSTPIDTSPEVVAPADTPMNIATPQWTKKRLNAALQAINAMLAGEEGEGDAEGIAFDDLEGAASVLRHELHKPLSQ